MSDYTFVFFCRVCNDQMKIESTTFEDGSGGVHRCSVCKTQCGLWLDGGTLDLGIVRDEQLNEDNDFQVFA